MTESITAAPILVFEGFDVSVYDSIGAAANGLESIDVKNGIYKAFDATGRVLELGVAVASDVTLLLRQTRTTESVVLSPSERVEPESLREHLRRFVNTVGAARMGTTRAFVEGADLAELVRLVHVFHTN